MPKPVLLSFIPPVTIGGVSSPVVANLFDASGNFRQRQGSFKRPRVEAGGDGSRDMMYDLSRDAAPPVLPGQLKLDTVKIRGLMVRANETATAIRTRISDSSAPPEFLELARSIIALLDLVSAVVEEGILPLSSSIASPTFAAVAGSRPNNNVPAKPRPEQGTAELKAALVAADKTAVIFDADLGPSPVANRVALNNALAAGLKAATQKVADEKGTDIAEGIRVVNDALSCADNVEFLGQTTVRKIDKSDPSNPIPMPFCTMPVKLDFPDRNTRIHFERTVRKHCDLKASISLPAPIRKYQGMYLQAMKERHRGKFVMVRPDTASLGLITFVKEEGDRSWTRCPGYHPIPRGIMLPDFTLPNYIDLPAVSLMEQSDGDDELLVAASIGAESQP
jgi:hypothetical protein